MESLTLLSLSKIRGVWGNWVNPVSLMSIKEIVVDRRKIKKSMTIDTVHLCKLLRINR